MADRDHNRSNDSGTGAKALDRDEVQQRSDQAGIAGEPQPSEADNEEVASDGSEPKVPPRRT